MEPHVDFTAPAALWHQFRGPADDAQRQVFRTPALLCFTSDNYMDDFLALMQTQPHRMRERLAVAETPAQRVPERAAIVPKRGLIGRLERARTAVVQRLEEKDLALVRAKPWNAAPAGAPLKLFHPASQRYYVLTASLICRTLGLPDHPINTSAHERIGFVLRMLSPNGELAFVNGTWQSVDGDSLAEGEDVNLMSPLTYVEDDGRRRRMYNGVIPVAKREAYVGAGAVAKDPRELSLTAKVFGPWASLEDVADAPIDAVNNSFDHPSPPRSPDFTAANEQIQKISALILADFDAWLQQNLEPVWRAIHGTGTISDPKHLAAFNELGDELRDALHDRPDNFQFVDREKQDRDSGTTVRKNLKAKLLAAISLPDPDTVPIPTRTAPSFVARCVYERPNCATVAPVVVSEPTTPFQLASFFDPDAPARPIRVEMPADTTPEGLRKYDKNTSFVMSDILCGQVQALRSMTFADLVLSVLPFPFHKPLKSGGGNIGPCTDGGMVCSLSIPIITICALVLLMIFVKLLDLVFFWMPFFQICFPTNFKSKG